MEYTFTQAEQKTEFSADKPRPVLDDGQYLVRIIHTERKEYKEALDGNGNKLENGGLNFVLVPTDQAFQDVRIRENIHLWHHKPDTRATADRKFKMIWQFAGLPAGSTINTDELIGRRVGVTVQRVTRFDDAGNRIEFNEIKRWHPGPDKQALSFSPKSDPNRTDAPDQSASFDSLFG
jgi:hypothetical protein